MSLDFSDIPFADFRERGDAPGDGVHLDVNFDPGDLSQYVEPCKDCSIGMDSWHVGGVAPETITLKLTDDSGNVTEHVYRIMK